MKLYEIMFSPTGGTRKVCGIIGSAVSSEFACETEEIDLMKKGHTQNTISSEDFCIIAVPSYGGRMPAPAKERLEIMEGQGAKAVLVVVYGNRAYEDTLPELKDSAQKTGFLPVAAITAVAEHSIMRQFAHNRPDAEDAGALKGYAEEIAAAFQAGKSFKPLKVPGNTPYKEYGGLPLHPRAGKKCVRCGTCAKVCPVGAIPVNNPRMTDNGKCITCMACVAACPQAARSLNPLLLAAASWKLKKVCGGRKENALIMEVS